MLPLSRSLCIPEEPKEATSYPGFDDPEPGFREIWPTWDGETVGRENSCRLCTLGSRDLPTCLHVRCEFFRIAPIGCPRAGISHRSIT